MTIKELKEQIRNIPEDYPIGVLIHLGRDSTTGKALVIEDDVVIFCPEASVKKRIGCLLIGVSEAEKED